MSRETVEFEERGFLGPVPLFDAGECGRILRQLGRAPDEHRAEWCKGHHVTARPFYELAMRQPILDRVAALLGDDVMLWGARLVTRAPGRRHAWHTDIETADPAARTVSVWIGLEHTTSRSALQLVSRSHRFGAPLQRVAGEKDRARGEATDADVEGWARERDPRSRLVRPGLGDGDAVLFDGRLWHGSHNTNPRGTRTALLLQYATPDTPIRIPDGVEWPFRFLESPRPPCIMVRGKNESTVNRMVSQPTPDASHLSCHAESLDLPLAKDEREGWQRHKLFRGKTPNVADLSCHASVLEPGRSPHAPHEHREEELLVMLAGEADLVIVDGDTERTRTLRRGSFVYYAAHQLHTLRNEGAEPATYAVFRWRGAETGRERVLSTEVFRWDDMEPAGATFARVFEGGTRYLEKLRSHFTTLPPGGGYEPHVDEHDVAIVVLGGTVETLGRRFGSNSVIFYPGGEPHGMRNVGEEPARYLVFEFHGGGARPSRWKRLLARIRGR